jgi:hypothetical protein
MIEMTAWSAPRRKCSNNRRKQVMKAPPDDETAKTRRKLPNARDKVPEPRSGIDAARVEAKSRVISLISITEIGSHLREVALRCIQLARENPGTRAAQELEDTSIELADRASSLEAALALWIDPDNDAQC